MNKILEKFEGSISITENFTLGNVLSMMPQDIPREASSCHMKVRILLITKILAKGTLAEFKVVRILVCAKRNLV